MSPTKKLEENMRQENARLSARVAAVEVRGRERRMVGLVCVCDERRWWIEEGMF